jgi:hypothetical protein
MRTAQLSCGIRLAPKPRQRHFGVGELWIDQLDGNLDVERLIEGAPDRTHAPLAKLRD